MNFLRGNNPGVAASFAFRLKKKKLFIFSELQLLFLICQSSFLTSNGQLSCASLIISQRTHSLIINKIISWRIQ